MTELDESISVFDMSSVEESFYVPPEYDDSADVEQLSSSQVPNYTQLQLAIHQCMTTVDPASPKHR